MESKIANESQTHGLSPLVRWLLVGTTVLYLSTFIFNGVTRTGRFSPDSMNYVNVARNIVAGEGITQPTLGFNQPAFSLEAKPPIPFTAQAPLYPVLIALVSLTGIPPAGSALLLATLASAVIFVLTYKLAARLYDARTGLTAAALLLFYYPIRWMAGWAWNDPIGVALVLLSFWLLVKGRGPRDSLLLMASGFTVGVAFAIRFALLPLFAVGFLFLIFIQRQWRERLTDLGIYSLGFLFPFGAVTVRNVLITGSISPPLNPVSVTASQTLIDIWRTVFGGFAAGLSFQHQIGLLGFSLAGVCIALLLRHRLRRDLTDIFLFQGRWILTLWSIGYLGFLVLQRSRAYFDVDARTIAPAGVALVVLWSALMIRALRIPMAVVATLALSLLAISTWREVHAAITIPPLDFQRKVHQSQRLTWLENHTTDEDLIVGDDVVDVPFYLHRSATLSFSPFPYTNHPTYDDVTSYARVHCHDYRNMILILHRNAASEEDWRYAFGDFFANLTFGRIAEYPRITPLDTLEDGLAFQIQCR